jgi:hypothetical protein
MSPPDEILEEYLPGPHLLSLSRQTFELIDPSEDIAASWLPLREPGSVPRRNCLTSRIIVEIINLDRFVDRNEVDPIYIDAPYYIYPNGELAAETFG